MAKTAFPALHALAIDKIPEWYRLKIDGCCFTQAAKTGSSKNGWCKIHWDLNSLINGIMQLGVDTKGGHTIIYGCEDDYLKNQPPAIEVIHRDCRCILGQFISAFHGSRDWENYRGIFACYLDVRVLEFFLCYRLRRDGEEGTDEFVELSEAEMVVNWDRYEVAMRELHQAPN